MPRPSASLARRIGEIRREMFGEHGAPLVAGALRIPTRTWLNYEAGVTIPAAVILRCQWTRIVTRLVNPNCYEVDAR
jgi:hypothetical protein